MALVLCLKIVEVGPVAVIRGADVMASAMHKERSIAGIYDDLARDVIRRAAAYWLTCGQALANKGNAGITRVTHNGKDLPLARGDLLAGPGETHPGVIGENSARTRQMRPEVEQHQVAAPNRALSQFAGIIVGIASIAVHGHQWAIGKHQALHSNQCREALLHAIFVKGGVLAQILAQLRE